MQAACTARISYQVARGHLVPAGDKYEWQEGILLDSHCQPWRGGRPFSNHTRFGIVLQETEPCPDPTPEPSPTPSIEPTPVPGDCQYTHFNLVWLCAEPSKPGCLDGRDWGRPGIVRIGRDGKYICGHQNSVKCVRAFLTAVLFRGGEKIEAGHACFPGPIPDGAWSQDDNPDMQYDCGHPWGENWNGGSCNIDFVGKNVFRLHAFGVSGETSMTSTW